MSISYEATVMCDDCPNHCPVEVSEYCGDVVGVEESDLPEGWVLVEEDTHLCPDCQKGDEDE